MVCGAAQCWVALQHFQGCHPEIRCEYSELFYVIRPDDPTLVAVGPAGALMHGELCKV